MERIIPLEDFAHIPLLFGSYNQHIKLMREAFQVKIIARDHLKIYGEVENVEQTCLAVKSIKEYILRKGSITPVEVKEIIAGQIANHPQRRIIADIEEELPVNPRSPGQRNYMKTIRNNEIVFAIGPAGTGKTYLAVAMAVDALRKRQVRKLVLVRPAVEAGEKLGFLPGDYQAKINPYLRPLYDALHHLWDYEKLKKYLDKDIVEIVPLAYMRGRTLESAFIILDEAQNTTIPQMKMFLTRLGLGSRIVVTGDITQTDLPRKEDSGLIHAQKILQDIHGITFFYLTKEDIVRHRLVQRIVEAYACSEKKPEANAVSE